MHITCEPADCWCIRFRLWHTLTHRMNSLLNAANIFINFFFWWQCRIESIPVVSFSARPVAPFNLVFFVIWWDCSFIVCGQSCVIRNRVRIYWYSYKILIYFHTHFLICVSCFWMFCFLMLLALVMDLATKMPRIHLIDMLSMPVHRNYSAWAKAITLTGSGRHKKKTESNKFESTHTGTHTHRCAHTKRWYPITFNWWCIKGLYCYKSKFKS